MRFHVIFYLPNGEGPRDEIWDSEFEARWGVTQEVANAVATEALAHPRFADYDGELIIMPAMEYDTTHARDGTDLAMPNTEATLRCRVIRNTAKTQAQTLVAQRAQERLEDEEARERAQYERLKKKFN